MNKLKIFQDKQIRSHWDAENELWYFSIIDIIAVLTGSDRPRKYWNDLKIKLAKEGSQLSEKIGQLKMKSTDGKSYLTDVADTESLFRLIQSIPSPKAEPFKCWLAKVGYERIEENEDPEKVLEFIKGTELRPYLELLDSDEERRKFEQLLLKRYYMAYPRSANGKVLFPYLNGYLFWHISESMKNKTLVLDVAKLDRFAMVSFYTTLKKSYTMPDNLLARLDNLNWSSLLYMLLRNAIEVQMEALL